MRISDWSSDVCSSDLALDGEGAIALVELQAPGILAAHLGIGALRLLVGQAFEIEAGRAEVVGLLADAVVERAADAGAGGIARRDRDHLQGGAREIGIVKQQRPRFYAPAA